jgi:hypothetical protein
MQLCGSSEIEPSAEPTVAGTMVSYSICYEYSVIVPYSHYKMVAIQNQRENTSETCDACT